MVNPTVRLQVFLSRSGVCSRRKAFDLVQSGVVKVNGKVVSEPSTPVDPAKDKIFVRGKGVAYKQYDYILLNKPKGCVTTKTDRHKEKTVFDCLPNKYQHLSPVGRLDKNTEGILLFTNDGDVAYALTHPKFNVDKSYEVYVRGRLERGKVQRLEKGVMIEGKKTAPAKIRNVKLKKEHTEFVMTIHEGRKRQIRLMMDKVGHRVTHLKRIKQGPLQLSDLKVGTYRPLSANEVEKLRKLKI